MMPLPDGFVLHKLMLAYMVEEHERARCETLVRSLTAACGVPPQAAAAAISKCSRKGSDGTKLALQINEFMADI